MFIKKLEHQSNLIEKDMYFHSSLNKGDAIES